MAYGLAFQGVTEPKKRYPNRYSDDLIADILEATRLFRDTTVEKAAEVIGLEPTSWYKKRDKVTPFKVSEIGRLAEHWGMPPGWPFTVIDASKR